MNSNTFIGSSTEGIKIANGIKHNLLNNTECHIWTEGVFLPGRTYIETLEKLLDKMDFAILVASPDDMLEKRNVSNFTMRDNVLLELGLFMAKLGRSRTYLFIPKDKIIHIPSDLLGVTSVNYESADSQEKLNQILKAPCNEILSAMIEADKELSISMRKILIKKLLSATNQIQKFVLSMQTLSLKHITDKNKFNALKMESKEKLNNIIKDYIVDFEKLNISEEAVSVNNLVNNAIDNIPFPEEINVSKDELVGGAFKHFLGGKSGGEQIKERLEKLALRYETWWNEYGKQITNELNSLQNQLISSL